MRCITPTSDGFWVVTFVQPFATRSDVARVVSEESARGVDLRAVFNAYDKGRTVSVLLSMYLIIGK